MNYFKRLLIVLTITIITLLCLIFFVTFLNYSNIINTKITNILKVIIPLFSLALGGYIMGKKASKKGYLEGLKIGLIVASLLLISNLILFEINIKDIIFYILLIISSVFGSMFGINMQKEK